ncbi:LRR receptor-like serine/threonine-protein kinase GSO1 [Prunus avium]|uniref:LRR receptor-like serine/threonine-protein kinase GSO1 n=1 Tax=Prunus avium TaxID=42229 RepID=A0A6P5S8A2_PRUAV|nr:LRR receptor-like serine/threonine-protein kinase GSO1 [Prunus avium]
MVERGVTVVHGTVSSAMRTLAMLLVLTSEAAVFMRLDLSDNDFDGSEIPYRLGHDLTSLTYLNLSYSAFFGQIPSEISKLSKLSTLDLSSYSSHLKWTKRNLRSLVQNLTNIKKLHLREVDIYSTVPDILVNASSLTSLQLDNCGLYGEFPVGIFHLPNLEALYVSYNSDLTRYFPTFNKCNVFKKLDIASTNFFGQLPTSLGNLHSLIVFAISSCNFHPNVPSSIGNLTQLSYLSMYSFNDVSKGKLSVSFSWVGKLTKLYHLSLGDTNIKGEFLSFVSNLTQLEYLDLAANEISGQIPSWLMKLTQLTTLTLGDNNLQGPIPRSLFQLKNLEYLFLSSNNLSGLVEFDQFSKLKKLKSLDLSNNLLSVEIRNDLSATLPKLETLALGFCNLTEFPKFLKNQSELTKLDLSRNYIHGPIPKWFWNATIETLLTLRLYDNFLTGFDQYPGILPWTNMIFLGLGFNMLQGPPPIPPQSIKLYDVENNEYTGEISPLFCNFNNLQVLELSNNNLSGMLPQCLGALPELRILILRSNGFHGVIGKPATKHEFPNLRIIDLSNNGFSGDLAALESLDLSQNQLSGRILSNLAQLTFLAYFNVSHNYLSGPIPLGEQFNTFQEDSYEGNSGLCGMYLPKKCEDSESSTRPPPSIVEEDEDSVFQIALDWYVVVPGVVSGLIVGVVVGNI